MNKSEDARWADLLGRSGAIDCARLLGIRVRAAKISVTQEDVILCPAEMADERIRNMRSSVRSARTMQPERMFLSRALSKDASTAAAMLVRAVVANWTAMRGHKKIHDEHERRAVALAEAQLSLNGITYDEEILSAQRQISSNHIKAPVAHDGPHEVIRKAIEQMAKQIGGRHVILVGDGPMAE